MTRPADVLDQARRWIGTTEQPKGSNRVPGITDWYGIGNGPWCAMFVSRVFYDAGLPLPATIAKGFAYCPSGVNWFKNQGRWKTGNPQPGDVVFFSWSGGRAEHVGIVESVNSDGTINTIEGNTNSAGSAEGLFVMRMRRRTGIIGYGTPAFDGSASVPKPPPAPSNAPPWGFVAVDGGFGPATVRALQSSLNATGANPRLSVDGDYGPSTKRALQGRLNHTNGPVAIDGNVGPGTIKALQRHVGASADGVWGAETTRRLQMALNASTF